jgi:hypothetical protein
MATRFLTAAALLARVASSEDVTIDSALAADDACRAGNDDCSVELLQVRGEINSAQAIIAKQLEENEKHEVALDDESGSVCTAPTGYKTVAMSCGGATKCCTSQPSYLSGTAHSAQAHLSLYSICCSVNDHCKYDTIFVSCAPGRGPDDYSGVIAGLQGDAQTNEESEDEVNDEQDATMAAEDEEAESQQAENDATMAAAEDEEAESQQVEDEEVEEAADETAEDEDGAEVTGGKCSNHGDMKVWKSGGKAQYDNALDHCGTSCAAGFPCTRDCMKKHGYSTGCASCMAHAVECGRDHCLSQCISNHKSKGCLHCNKKACRHVMKRCSGWAVGGH